MTETPATRVLVVDDDKFAIALVSKHLKTAGYEVLTATNGAEALKIVLAEGPAMVVTDWMMPVMNGLELCRAIRNHEGVGFVFVIVLTAVADEDRVVEAFDAGADDYLTKPFKRKELLARLRAGQRIIELQQTLDRNNRQLHLVNAEAEVSNRKLGLANSQLNRMATTDELTGLTNRREALRFLSELWSTAERHPEPLACAILDLDHFKRVNDTFGHAAGDLVLKKVSQTLQTTSRRGERVCRFGGEEFLIIFPHSSAEEAAVGAERMRDKIEATVIQHHEISIRVTASIGIAERAPSMESADELLCAADTMLYEAKRSGRNRVCVAGTISVSNDKTAQCRMDWDMLTRSDQEQNDKQGTSGHVLVVDDDSSVRSRIRGILEPKGYQVSEAIDGIEALEQIKLDLPDVVIASDAMPRMNGFELVRKLEADVHTRTVPVILSGSSVDGTDVVAGLETGAEEYLTKPIASRELVLRVRSMARLRREHERSNHLRGEQSRMLGALLDFSHSISAADSLDCVLEQTVSVAAELTRCRVASVFLPDVDQKMLKLAKTTAVETDAIRTLSIPMQNTVIGDVFQSRKPAVIRQYKTASKFAEATKGLPLYTLPAIFAPMCAPEGSVGVLHLADQYEKRPLSELELEYINLVCNIAASAIQGSLTLRARDDARDSIVIALAKLAEHRDNDTGKHLERVSRYCRALAEELRHDKKYAQVITQEFLADLNRAAPLHDIGKVAVPDSILMKPGRLTESEIEIMRTHAAIGANTLHSVQERAPGTKFLVMAEQIAHGHHEWVDGTGYPRNMSGDDIPLAARIAAIADVYDALTTKRVYKEAYTHDRASAIIVEYSDRQFDTRIVDAFVACEGEFQRLASELADDEAHAPPVHRLPEMSTNPVGSMS